MDDKNIEALQLQVQSMSSILEHINAYFFIKDLSGKYIYVNKRVEDVFQTTAENIIGKDDSHFFDVKQSDELRVNDENVINNNITVEKEEINIIKLTNEERIYKTIKKPLFDANNNVIGLFGCSTDITDEKHLKKENSEQKHLLDAILDNVEAYIYMKDSTRTFRYVNSKVAELFGVPAEDIIGKKDCDVIPKEFADHFWQSDKLVFTHNRKQIIHEAIADNTGKLRQYQSVKVPYQFMDNTQALIGFSSDVTELYELKERFKQLANTDYLTDVYNRRYFFERAEEHFQSSQTHQQSLAVITLDIDHFKTINDQYGHLIGDQALIKVAQLIKKNSKTEYIFARIGGEEFSILVPNTTETETWQIAEELRILLAKNPIVINDEIKFSVKISLGISSMLSKDASFQDLYARSDKALYLAKAKGRNQTQMVK